MQYINLQTLLNQDHQISIELLGQILGSEFSHLVIDKYPHPHKFILSRLDYLETILEQNDENDDFVVLESVKNCVWALGNCAATKELALDMGEVLERICEMHER